MIYTSYFSKLSKFGERFPEGFSTVSIAAKSPSWYKGAKCKLLAPKYWFYAKYKKDGDSDFYTEQYNKEVLNSLTVNDVVTRLRVLTRDASNIILLCYESPDKFCHRHLVAEWLNKNGYECEEVKF